MPNGAFVEDVIDACKQRLEAFQETMFACDENARAIFFLEAALGELDSLTKRRVKAGVEGSYEDS